MPPLHTDVQKSEVFSRKLTFKRMLNDRERSHRGGEHRGVLDKFTSFECQIYPSALRVCAYWGKERQWAAGDTQCKYTHNSSPPSLCHPLPTRPPPPWHIQLHRLGSSMEMTKTCKSAVSAGSLCLRTHIDTRNDVCKPCIDTKSHAH